MRLCQTGRNGAALHAAWVSGMDSGPSVMEFLENSQVRLVGCTISCLPHDLRLGNDGPRGYRDGRL